MNAVEAILCRCKDLLLAMNTGANVYDYTPYGNTQAALQAIMLDQSTPPIIHFWAITRESTPSTDESIPAVDDKHKVVFRGWRGLTGDGCDSSKAFTAEIEQIRSTFLNNRKLLNTDGDKPVPNFFCCGPMQVRVQMTGSFTGFLVHYTEIVMQAEVYPIDYDNSE